jgi:hypothetical protein
MNCRYLRGTPDDTDHGYAHYFCPAYGELA